MGPAEAGAGLQQGDQGGMGLLPWLALSGEFLGCLATSLHHLYSFLLTLGVSFLFKGHNLKSNSFLRLPGKKTIALQAQRLMCVLGVSQSPLALG